MTPIDSLRYDGVYFSTSWVAGGFIVLAGDWALAYPLWGTKRELFERWREKELLIPMKHLFKVDLRDEKGVDTKMHNYLN